MKQLLPILLFAGCVLHVHAATINFGSDVPGTVPKGWSVFMTHQGGAPKWEVIADRTAPSKKGYVVGQTSKDQTDGRFPLLILEAPHQAGALVRSPGGWTRAPAWCGASRIRTIITSPEPTRWKTTSCCTRSKKVSAFRWRPWANPPTPMDFPTMCPLRFGTPCELRSRARFSPFTSTARKCSMWMTRHSRMRARWVCGPSLTVSSLSTILT